MQEPGFGARIGLAFGAFFKILFDGAFAARVLSAQSADPAALGRIEHDTDTAPHAVEDVSVPDTVPVAPIEAPHTEPMPDPHQETRKAMQFLGALQREGRFIDFLMEDLNAAADADIGAAARVVHGGCKKVLDEYLTIEPVWTGEEGSRVVLEEGFDPQRVNLTGNVSGEPPFNGTLAHPGWRASDSNLPQLADSVDASILMPAEIEL